MDKKDLTDIARLQAISKELGEIISRLLSGHRTPIETLNLPNRTRNVLLRSGIEYVEQLLKMEDIDFRRIRNLGLRQIAEIKEKLSTLTIDKP